jgi:subtilisin family serine protease
MKRTLPFLICTLVLSGWILRPTNVRSQSRLEHIDGHPVVAGEILVRFRADARAHMEQIERDLDADDNRPVGAGGWRRIRSASRSAQTLLTALAARSDVLEVQPNYIVHSTVIPNDPAFTSLWGLKNSALPGADIHATAAWDVTTGSAGTVVGMIDTGVLYTHADLAANMWTAPTGFTVRIGGPGPDGMDITCPMGSHGFNAITLSCNPLDDNGHGTHTAGTVGAVGNNSIGVVGVNWTTRLMALKFLDSGGSGSVGDAVNAIDFAIQTKARFASTKEANVRVLSNSWGGYGSAPILSDAIQRAQAADILFVAAAGNNGLNTDAQPFYPASYPTANVVAVAATDSSDALAGFSNYGATSVDLGAPGVAITSTWITGGYAEQSGTSMATPHVAGAAALVLSGCALTTSQLKATLLNNVDILPSLDGKVVSKGRLNVDRAIRSCVTLPTSTLTSPVDGASFIAPATITFGATASDPDGISKVEFYAGTTLIGTSTTFPYGGTWTGVGAGTYTVKAKAYDTVGLSTTSSGATITVSNPSGSSQTLLTTQVPAATFNDGVPHELGVRLFADVVGQFTAVRFWKAGNETGGTHVGRIWSAAGQLLGSVTFTNETASGWQQQTLTSPVPVTANTEYVISVNTANSFVDTQQAFSSGLINGDLHALGGANGVYGAPGAFPTSSYASSNYFRDVVFVVGGGTPDTTPPTVTLQAPAANSTVSGVVTLTADASDDVGVTGVQFQVDGGNVGTAVPTPPYTTTWDSRNVSNGLHTITAIASDAAGHQTPASVTVSVNNTGPAPQTLLTTQVPAATFSDDVPYELGVRLFADAAGQFTAVRFWKAGNEAAGTHVGRIWNAAGQLLASATFTNETASGWQQQTLNSPLPVTANTEYVVSVNTENLFVDTQQAFSNGLVNGNLHALGGANGVYGPPGAFPTGSYASSNYFRDVVFIVGSGPASQTLLTTQVPVATFNDGVPHELGVHIVADAAGEFTAVRFWKAGNETGGAHVGHIWSAAGQLLASVTFTNETASGWQQQTLTSPVSVTANTEYVISVNTANFFVDTQQAFTNPLFNGNLHAPGGVNGVFGVPGAFPTNSYASSNYFRDVVFAAFVQ